METALQEHLSLSVRKLASIEQVSVLFSKKMKFHKSLSVLTSDTDPKYYLDALNIFVRTYFEMPCKYFVSAPMDQVMLFPYFLT